MIFTAISSFVLGLLALLLTLLPDADAGVLTDLETGLEPFRGMLAGANWLFPVSTFLGFLGMVLAIELIMFGYKSVMWLLRNVSLGFFKD